jgi:phosphoglycolate phosphatase
VIKAVLIDLDGTLLDTAPDLASSARASPCWCAARCRTPSLFERGLPLFERYYAEESGRQSKPYPGAREGVEEMRKLGLRLACVTNKAERFTRALLERTGFQFDAVVCGDHVARRKPDPMAVVLACERLQVAPREALFIGDSDNDVGAARAARCAVWCVPYGYNEGRSPQTLACDAMVATLAEAAAKITQLVVLRS